MMTLTRSEAQSARRQREREDNPKTFSDCECGCGESVSSSRRFVHNHHRRKSPVEYVVDESGCWLWQRTLTADGYGFVGIGGRKTRRAHAAYYVAKHGEVPEGHELHHVCGVRRCVNPDHLEPLTRLAHRRRHPRCI